MNKPNPFLIGGVVLVIAFVVAYVSLPKKTTAPAPLTATTQTETPTMPSTITQPNTTTKTTTKVPTTSVKPTSPTPPVVSNNPGEYRMADVAKHNTKADCWTTINGGVYNVTSWISEHPGGESAIIGLCGIDGSNQFNDQHEGQRRPANELAGFKIGVLVQ